MAWCSPIHMGSGLIEPLSIPILRQFDWSCRFKAVRGRVVKGPVTPIAQLGASHGLTEIAGVRRASVHNASWFVSNWE